MPIIPHADYDFTHLPTEYPYQLFVERADLSKDLRPCELPLGILPQTLLPKKRHSTKAQSSARNRTVEPKNMQGVGLATTAKPRKQRSNGNNKNNQSGDKSLRYDASNESVTEAFEKRRHETLPLAFRQRLFMGDVLLGLMAYRHAVWLELKSQGNDDWSIAQGILHRHLEVLRHSLIYAGKIAPSSAERSCDVPSSYKSNWSRFVSVSRLVSHTLLRTHASKGFGSPLHMRYLGSVRKNRVAG